MVEMAKAFDRALERKGMNVMPVVSRVPAKKRIVHPTTTIALSDKETKELAIENPAEGWKYWEFTRASKVLVKVPKKSKKMLFVPAHSFKSAQGLIMVPDRWKFGHNVDGHIVVNQNYYGPKDLIGKKAVFDVVFMIREKGDRKYLLLDFYHLPDTAPEKELKYPVGGTIPIPGSTIGISVIERAK